MQGNATLFVLCSNIKAILNCDSFLLVSAECYELELFYNFQNVVLSV